jgi:PhzF family phenazine biosynthesis protein
MSEVIIYHYDAFSTIPDQGNPAGVVLHADSLSEQQMQSIARKVGFNESVFVLHSQPSKTPLQARPLVDLAGLSVKQEKMLAGTAEVRHYHKQHSFSMFCR